MTWSQVQKSIKENILSVLVFQMILLVRVKYRREKNKIPPSSKSVGASLLYTSKRSLSNNSSISQSMHQTMHYRYQLIFTTNANIDQNIERNEPLDQNVNVDNMVNLQNDHIPDDVEKHAIQALSSHTNIIVHLRHETIHYETNCTCCVIGTSLRSHVKLNSSNLSAT